MARKATNPENIKDKGFDKHPENINKEGRPRKLPDLDKLLAEVLGDHLPGNEGVKAILLALRRKAQAGDIRAIELILDRAYGKVKNTASFDIEFGKVPEEVLNQIISKIIDGNGKKT